jgi:glyoxylase-like metal-dependent hydrolase (beta-lactamase superfamily II)
VGRDRQSRGEGGNGVFADAGASILAHRNVRTWIHAENLRLIGDKAPQSIKTMIQGLTRPSVLYIDGVNLYLGEREIQVRFFPGHTGSDSVVFVPDAGVAFAGDLLWRNMVPNTSALDVARPSQNDDRLYFG